MKQGGGAQRWWRTLAPCLRGLGPGELWRLEQAVAPGRAHGPKHVFNIGRNLDFCIEWSLVLFVILGELFMNFFKFHN